jgi:hypothetical protein
MTAWDLFAIAVQRWVITVVCAVLTGLVVFSVLQARPVYFTQVRVVLLTPALPESNSLGSTSASLVDLAGIVARKVQGVDPQALPVSYSVTLFDQGIRSGYAVIQPNLGGQWAYNFQDPVLDVQAVASSPELAQKQLQTALTAIQASLKAIQDDQGVSSADRVRTRLSPSSPHATEQKGSSIRAVAAATLAGGLVTAALLAGLGRKRVPSDTEVKKRGWFRRAANRPPGNG